MSPPRIAVCSWSLRAGDPAELVDRIRGTDLAAVQLALTPLVEQPAAWEGTIETLREAEIEIVSGMMAMAGEDYSTLESIAVTGGVRRDDRWSANRRHAAQVADLAAAAEIDLVTFHAGFLPEDRDDPERQTLLGRLREIAECFDLRGVRLAFETGQETAGTLLAALDDLGHPQVGVNFDPANMILYGKGDPVEALAALARKVFQIHIKDAIPTATPGTWGTETPVGEGAVPWDRFFDIARALDPPVDFVIEREAGEDRTADIIRARDLIRAHLGTNTT